MESYKRHTIAATPESTSLFGIHRKRGAKVVAAAAANCCEEHGDRGHAMESYKGFRIVATAAKFVGLSTWVSAFNIYKGSGGNLESLARQSGDAMSFDAPTDAKNWALEDAQCWIDEHCESSECSGVPPRAALVVQLPERRRTRSPRLPVKRLSSSPSLFRCGPRVYEQFLNPFCAGPTHSGGASPI